MQQPPGTCSLIIPKQYAVRLRAAPKLGNLYWCTFPDPEHVHLPEMWKTRPVIVISRRNRLIGKVSALPLSTEIRNRDNKHSFQLSRQICELLTGDETWVLCDHIVTVSTSRLSQVRGYVPSVRGQELAEILDLMHSALGSARRAPPQILDIPGNLI